MKVLFCCIWTDSKQIEQLTPTPDVKILPQFWLSLADHRAGSIEGSRSRNARRIDVRSDYPVVRPTPSGLRISKAFNFVIDLLQ